MNNNWHLNEIDHQLIDLACREDLGATFFDATTSLLFPNSQQQGKAKIISKHPEPIVVCGLPVVNAILAKFTQEYELKVTTPDGAVLNPGDTLLEIMAPSAVLVMAERTLLNFLQRLSAVATLTRCYALAIQNTKTKILDTRKTTPGFRHLEKYAVMCGGGVNHRMGLYDAIMIKDTHVDLLGGMSKTLQRLPELNKHKLAVIVEVRNSKELSIVLAEATQKVSRVLLDNMSLSQLKECVELCHGILPTEASGSINLENVNAIAACGVDFVSIGKLTHSAGSVDLSMKSE